MTWPTIRRARGCGPASSSGVAEAAIERAPDLARDARCHGRRRGSTRSRNHGRHGCAAAICACHRSILAPRPLGPGDDELRREPERAATSQCRSSARSRRCRDDRSSARSAWRETWRPWGRARRPPARRGSAPSQPDQFGPAVGARDAARLTGTGSTGRNGHQIGVGAHRRRPLVEMTRFTSGVCSQRRGAGRRGIDGGRRAGEVEAVDEAQAARRRPSIRIRVARRKAATIAASWPAAAPRAQPARDEQERLVVDGQRHAAAGDGFRQRRGELAVPRAPVEAPGSRGPARGAGRRSRDRLAASHCRGPPAPPAPRRGDDRGAGAARRQRRSGTGGRQSVRRGERQRNNAPRGQAPCRFYIHSDMIRLLDLSQLTGMSPCAARPSSIRPRLERGTDPVRTDGELALFAAVGGLLFALDDLLVDLIYFVRAGWRSVAIYSRYPRAFADALAPPDSPGRLAVSSPRGRSRGDRRHAARHARALRP